MAKAPLNTKYRNYARSPFKIRTTVGGVDVGEWAGASAKAVDEIMLFAGARIEQGITGVGGVFYKAAFGLGAKAGRAFPMIYRIHLYQYMASRPVFVTPMGLGKVGIEFVLDLGTDEDYERGFHHNALIDTGVPTADRRKKQYFMVHPAKVGFPPGYNKQDLLNTRERRIQWWNEHIGNGGGGDVEIRVYGRKGGGFRRIRVPTYEEVAYERLFNAWALTGKAPQWKILEYGTHQGSQPFSPPLHFTEFIAVASQCYAQQVMRAAARTIVQLGEQRAIRVGTVSSRYGKRAVVRNELGQFTQYKGLLEANLATVDTDICFGGL